MVGSAPPTLAENGDGARSHSYTRYRQGRLLRQAGAYGEAETMLLRALSASETFHEFSLIAAYELANFYEAQRALDRAASTTPGIGRCVSGWCSRWSSA